MRKEGCAPYPETPSPLLLLRHPGDQPTPVEEFPGKIKIALTAATLLLPRVPLASAVLELRTLGRPRPSPSPRPPTPSPKQPPVNRPPRRPRVHPPPRPGTASVSGGRAHRPHRRHPVSSPVSSRVSRSRGGLPRTDLHGLTRGRRQRQLIRYGGSPSRERSGHDAPPPQVRRAPR